MLLQVSIPCGLERSRKRRVVMGHPRYLVKQHDGALAVHNRRVKFKKGLPPICRDLDILANRFRQLGREMRQLRRI